MAYISAEDVKAVRKELKAAYPKYKFSVRKGAGSYSLDVTLVKGPRDLSDITDKDGYPSNTVHCYARNDTEFGFDAADLSDVYIADAMAQVGSRYFIANASDLNASDFTFKSATPNSDGTVQIELAEYRDEMYEMDP